MSEGLRWALPNREPPRRRPTERADSQQRRAITFEDRILPPISRHAKGSHAATGHFPILGHGALGTPTGWSMSRAIPQLEIGRWTSFGEPCAARLGVEYPGWKAGLREWLWPL